MVTHYYVAGRRPFLNLSDLADDDLGAVLAELDQLRREGRQHRPFGRRYMDLRRLTEARLRSLFIEAGGLPDRPSPHYFVLGESPWYEHLADQMERVQLPLSSLPADKTSLTYPDSFVAMECGEQFGVGHDRAPYHGRVFRLSELPELVERFGLPTPGWDDDHVDWTNWPRETFVEVQLWTDAPVRSFLS